MGKVAEKKKSGCLKVFLIIVGVFVVLGIIGALLSNSSSESDGTSSKGTSSSQNQEEIYAEAQKLFDEGSYTEAKAAVEKAIKIENKDEYVKLKTDIEAKVNARKSELEAKFEIKDDKVENITFISPSSEISKGLTFYPYIGIKDSKKYMLLRVGFQEEASKALIAFTSIKVRAGDLLEELKFSHLDKMNNVDILGSGMTELVDVKVNNKVEDLLSEVIPATDEVIIRFEDISNKTKDYTLTDKQKQTIADILEYYSYLD